MHAIECFHEKKKIASSFLIASFWLEWLRNKCFNGSQILIKQYDKSLVNYRGNTFNFYRENIAPIETQALHTYKVVVLT